MTTIDVGGQHVEITRDAIDHWCEQRERERFIENQRDRKKRAIARDLADARLEAVRLRSLLNGAVENMERRLNEYEQGTVRKLVEFEQRLAALEGDA